MSNPKPVEGATFAEWFKDKGRALVYANSPTHWVSMEEAARLGWEAAFSAAPAPCFTCEGEQGQPATRTVRICEACFGEEAPAPARDGVREAKGEGAPPTKCRHGIWIGHNCWQCDNDIPAQPSELPIREMAQEILKPHWPVVHNMEENAAREREVDRIEAVLRRAAKEQADGQV